MKNNGVRRPGVEPGSIAWKATMLTATPPTLESRARQTVIYCRCSDPSPYVWTLKWIWITVPNTDCNRLTICIYTITTSFEHIFPLREHICSFQWTNLFFPFPGTYLSRDRFVLDYMCNHCIFHAIKSSQHIQTYVCVCISRLKGIG